MFVSVAACFNIAYGCGMRFCALDAAFSKHAIYCDGHLHLLTTRDGNNKIIVLAWALCETESGPTYKWFADQCHAAGIGRYLGQNTVIFTDRMKGIKHFFDVFNRAKQGHCFQHILGKARKHIRGTGRTFEDGAAWAMRNAPTEAKFRAALERVRAQSPAAAHYFDTKVDHSLAYQYALNKAGVPTHNFKTSQIVECMNGVFAEARMFTPYYLNNVILSWIGNEIDARQTFLRKWALTKKHILTPYCARLWAIQVRSHARLDPRACVGPTNKSVCVRAD